MLVLSFIFSSCVTENESEHFLKSTLFSQALIVSFLPDYNWYKRYYTASLRILEYDPRREVCWSFITDSNVAQSLDMKAFSMKMYLWNETKVINFNTFIIAVDF